MAELTSTRKTDSLPEVDMDVAEVPGTHDDSERVAVSDEVVLATPSESPVAMLESTTPESHTENETSHLEETEQAMNTHTENEASVSEDAEQVMVVQVTPSESPVARLEIETNTETENNEASLSEETGQVMGKLVKPSNSPAARMESRPKSPVESRKVEPLTITVNEETEDGTTVPTQVLIYPGNDAETIDNEALADRSGRDCESWVGVVGSYICDAFGPFQGSEPFLDLREKISFFIGPHACKQVFKSSVCYLVLEKYFQNH